MKAAERSRLYLVVPSGVAPAELATAIDGGDIACVELTAPTLGLIALAQGRGIAVMVRDDPERARALGCDGVFLTADDADVAAARRIVGPTGIVGIDAGTSRHRAMEAAELGADVVALDPALIDWWAALFVVPCLARPPAALADIAGLVAVGVDFVAVDGAVWTAAEGARAAIAALNAALDTAWATC